MSGQEFRYFVSYATGDDGLPVTGNDPSFFRVSAEDRVMSVMSYLVEFWDGGEWVRSIVQPFSAYLDDVLISGSTLRELTEPEKDLPPAALLSDPPFKLDMTQVHIVHLYTGDPSPHTYERWIMRHQPTGLHAMVELRRRKPLSAGASTSSTNLHDRCLQELTAKVQAAQS
jgi:hypothetical protein